MNIEIINGGVCAAKGFSANCTHAWIRKNKTKKDISLIYSNVEGLDDYHNKILSNEKPIENIEVLSIDDKIQEKIFMGLRMNNGIKFIDFKKQFDIDFEEKYKEKINVLEENKLINKDEYGIRLTQKGREISNSVFIEFLD